MQRVIHEEMLKGHDNSVLTTADGKPMDTEAAIEHRMKLDTNREKKNMKKNMNVMGKFVRKMSTDEHGRALQWLWDVSSLEGQTFHFPQWHKHGKGQTGSFLWDNIELTSFNWWDLVCCLHDDDFKKVFGNPGDCRGITKVAWLVVGGAGYHWMKGGDDFQMSVWCGKRRFNIRCDSQGRGPWVTEQDEELKPLDAEDLKGRPGATSHAAWGQQVAGSDADHNKHFRRKTYNIPTGDLFLYGGYTDPDTQQKMQNFIASGANTQFPTRLLTSTLREEAKKVWPPIKTVMQQSDGDGSGDGAAALAGPVPDAPAANTAQPVAASAAAAAADAANSVVPAAAPRGAATKAPPRRVSFGAAIPSVPPSPAAAAPADTQQRAAATPAGTSQTKKAPPTLPPSLTGGASAAGTTPAALAGAAPTASTLNDLRDDRGLAHALPEQPAAAVEQPPKAAPQTRSSWWTDDGWNSGGNGWWSASSRGWTGSRNTWGAGWQSSQWSGHGSTAADSRWHEEQPNTREEQPPMPPPAVSVSAAEPEEEV